MRTARLVAAFALVLAGFALIAVALMPSSPARAVAATEAPAAVEVDPFLVALAPGTHFAPEHADALLAAADRVCEGVTAEVPVVDMANALAESLGLTDEEARDFVNTAATVHCAPEPAV